MKYLALLEKVGSWAGNLELAALPSTLDRPIYVLHETGQIYGFNQEGSQKNPWVWYSRSQGHYESLQMTSEVALTLRAKALVAKPTGGRQEHRGGGKSTSSLGGLTKKSSSLGGKTRKSMSFRQNNRKTPSLGGLTKGSAGHLRGKTKAAGSVEIKDRKRCFIHSPKKVASSSKKLKTKFSGPHTASSQKQNASVGGQTGKVQFWSGVSGTSKARSADLSAASRTTKEFKDCHNSKTKVTKVADSNPLLVGKRAPKKAWTCNLRHITLYDDPNLCTLARRRTNHIYSRHPHEKELVSKMREYSEPVVASAGIPLDQRDWCCPFCPKALPSLAKALKEKSVRHHSPK